jgi:hypothetical protein
MLLFTTLEPVKIEESFLKFEIVNYRGRHRPCLPTPPGPAFIGGVFWGFFKGKWLYQSCRIHTFALSESKPIGKAVFWSKKMVHLEKRGVFLRLSKPLLSLLSRSKR